MKIKTFKIKKLNLTKLYLLKYKIYKNFSTTDFPILNFLKYIEFTLKQSLILISNYHLKKKKILFLGFTYPYRKHKQNVFKNSNHTFLPKSLWLNGMVKNNLLLNNISYKKKPDLIVFFDRKDTDYFILKELDNLNIPIIIFGESVCSKNNRYYNILGNLEKIELKKLFQFLVYSVIKTEK